MNNVFYDGRKETETFSLAKKKKVITALAPEYYSESSVKETLLYSKLR